MLNQVQGLGGASFVSCLACTRGKVCSVDLVDPFVFGEYCLQPESLLFTADAGSIGHLQRLAGQEGMGKFGSDASLALDLHCLPSIKVLFKSCGIELTAKQLWE